MLYDDWLGDVTRRFQQSFDNIAVTHNFDFGPEFEIAVAQTLQDLLPQRFGVCRGFVVGRDGNRAGDDIIVFDAQRFPTLRALDKDLSRKEAVPAEAVLAYIEAKHTLLIDGDESVGQSLAKATRQVEAVKRVHRPAVTHEELIYGINLGGFAIKLPPGYPSIRNPYYAAVWARHVKTRSENPTNDFLLKLTAVCRERANLPDAIVAGTSLALPFLRQDNNASLLPFVCEKTELGTLQRETASWGIALAHLIWAIEWIRLGDLPWSTMIGEQLGLTSLNVANPPIRGSRFP